MWYFVWYSGCHRNTTDTHYHYHITLCYITKHFLWYEIFCGILWGNLGTTGIPQTPIFIPTRLHDILPHNSCDMRYSCYILCGNLGTTGIPQVPIFITTRLYITTLISCSIRYSCGTLCGTLGTTGISQTAISLPHNSMLYYHTFSVVWDLPVVFCVVI